MAVTKSVKSGAKKTNKAGIGSAARGTKKMLKPATNTLKGSSGKGSPRSKKSAATKTKK